MAQHDDVINDWEVFDSFDGAAPTQDPRGVLIRVRDPIAVAKAQGGNMAAAAAAVGPDFVAGKVFQGIADKIAAGFKDQKIDADVFVVQAAGYAPVGSSTLSKVLFVGVGAAIGGVLAVFLKRKKK
jgi:hypothetical protein